MKKLLLIFIAIILLFGVACEEYTPNQPSDDGKTAYEKLIKNATVGTGFGFFHNSTLNIYEEHSGIDFLAEAGTNVFAFKDGTVKEISTNDLIYEPYVIIDHEDGMQTIYRYVIPLVKVGSKVKEGQVIATAAETSGSEYKIGPHLHFEIRKDNRYVNPDLLIEF